MESSCWWAEVSIPGLLRHARTAYGDAMRAALEAAGCADVPANGMYVIGSLARSPGRSLSQLVEELGGSKQAAGQVVDTLVLRGYLARVTDAQDRRKIVLSLTPRGEAAAEVQAAGRARIDAALLAEVGEDCVQEMRRGLAALCMIRRADAESSATPPAP